MKNPELQKQVLHNIGILQEQGYKIVIVHGGGPFIQEALDTAQIKSDFIDGHRKTSREAFRHVEMALKGRVNGELVGLLNTMGYRAVGLSGKDGNSVTACKRVHWRKAGDPQSAVDLGQVGDVAQVQPALINLLLENNYLPVVTCIANDSEGNGYNINGDLFAGHLAGVLGAQAFVVLTDVDGLMRNINDPDSLMTKLSTLEIAQLREEGIIQGGMIPKLEACETAIKLGAASARIINGTKPEQISQLSAEQLPGTLICHAH